MDWKNAPGVFQRYMEECVSDLRDEYCLSNLDDTIFYNPTIEEAIHHVWQVMQRLRIKGVKLKAKKRQVIQN